MSTLSLCAGEKVTSLCASPSQEIYRFCLLLGRFLHRSCLSSLTWQCQIPVWFPQGRKHYRLRGLSFEGKVLGTKQTFILLLLAKAFGMVNCDILGFPGKMWMFSSISYLPGISHRHEDIKLVLALSIQSASSLHLATLTTKSRWNPTHIICSWAPVILSLP